MSEDPIKEHLDLVRSYLRETGVAKSTLTKKAGLNNTALKRIERDDWNPRADTLRRLLKAIPKFFKEHQSAS